MRYPKVVDTLDSFNFFVPKTIVSLEEIQVEGTNEGTIEAKAAGDGMNQIPKEENQVSDQDSTTVQEESIIPEVIIAGDLAIET